MSNGCCKFVLLYEKHIYVLVHEEEVHHSCSNIISQALTHAKQGGSIANRRYSSDL